MGNPNGSIRAFFKPFDKFLDRLDHGTMILNDRWHSFNLLPLDPQQHMSAVGEVCPPSFATLTVANAKLLPVICETDAARAAPSSAGLVA